jgi:hypothetical protein
MVVDLPGLLKASIEALCDPASTVGVPRQEDQWRVVAALGAEVDLWHAR